MHLCPYQSIAIDVGAFVTRWRRTVMPAQRNRGSVYQLYMLKYHGQLMKDMGFMPPKKGVLSLKATITSADYKAAFVPPPGFIEEDPVEAAEVEAPTSQAQFCYTRVGPGGKACLALKSSIELDNIAAIQQAPKAAATAAAAALLASGTERTPSAGSTCSSMDGRGRFGAGMQWRPSPPGSAMDSPRSQQREVLQKVHIDDSSAMRVAAAAADPMQQCAQQRLGAGSQGRAPARRAVTFNYGQLRAHPVGSHSLHSAMAEPRARKQPQLVEGPAATPGIDLAVERSASSAGGSFTLQHHPPSTRRVSFDTATCSSTSLSGSRFAAAAARRQAAEGLAAATPAGGGAGNAGAGAISNGGSSTTGTSEPSPPVSRFAAAAARRRAAEAAAVAAAASTGDDNSTSEYAPTTSRFAAAAARRKAAEAAAAAAAASGGEGNGNADCNPGDRSVGGRMAAAGSAAATRRERRLSNGPGAVPRGGPLSARARVRRSQTFNVGNSFSMSSFGTSDFPADLPTRLLTPVEAAAARRHAAEAAAAGGLQDLFAESYVANGSCFGAVPTRRRASEGELAIGAPTQLPTEGKHRRYSDGPGALMMGAARGRVRPSHTFNWGNFSRPVAPAQWSSARASLDQHHSADGHAFAAAAARDNRGSGARDGVGARSGQRRMSDGPGAFMLAKYIRPGLAAEPGDCYGGATAGGNYREGMAQGSMGPRIRRNSERRPSIGPQAILEDSALVVEEVAVEQKPRVRASRTFHCLNVPQAAAGSSAGFATGPPSPSSRHGVRFAAAADRSGGVDSAAGGASVQLQDVGGATESRAMEVRRIVRRARTFTHGNSSRPVAAISLNDLHAHGPSHLSTPAAARRQAAEAAIAAAASGGGGAAAAAAAGGRGGVISGHGNSLDSDVHMGTLQARFSAEAAAAGAISAAGAADVDHVYQPAEPQLVAEHVLRLPRGPAGRRLSSLSLASNGSYDGGVVPISGLSKRRPSFLFAAGSTSPSAVPLLSSDISNFELAGQRSLSGGTGSFGSSSSRVAIGEGRGESSSSAPGESYSKATLSTSLAAAAGLGEELGAEDSPFDRSQHAKLDTEHAEREVSGDNMVRAGSQGLPMHVEVPQQGTSNAQQHPAGRVVQCQSLKQQQQQGHSSAPDKLVNRAAFVGVAGLRSMASETGSASSSEGSSFRRMRSNLSDRLRTPFSSSAKSRQGAAPAATGRESKAISSREASSVSRGSSHASKAAGGGSWPHRSPAVPLGAESCPSQDPLAPIRQLVMQLQEQAEMERDNAELNQGALSVAAIWRREEQERAEVTSTSERNLQQQGSVATRQAASFLSMSCNNIPPPARGNAESQQQQMQTRDRRSTDLARQQSSRSSNELSRQGCNALQHLDPAALAGAAEQAMRRHKQLPRRQSSVESTTTTTSARGPAGGGDAVAAWVQEGAREEGEASAGERTSSSGHSDPLTGLRVERCAAAGSGRARRMSLAFEPHIAAPLLSADHLLLATPLGPANPRMHAGPPQQQQAPLRSC